MARKFLTKYVACQIPWKEVWMMLKIKISGCEEMVIILWEVKVVDVPFCYGMGECFIKTFHI
jgi:hypothetical protein